MRDRRLSLVAGCRGGRGLIRQTSCPLAPSPYRAFVVYFTVLRVAMILEELNVALEVFTTTGSLWGPRIGLVVYLNLFGNVTMDMYSPDIIFLQRVDDL